MGERTGAQPVRLGCDRRDRAGDGATQARHRGHVPAHPNAPGDRGAGRGHARLYDVPDEPPELIVAAAAEQAAKLAARWGDGLISTAPSREVVDTYKHAGGSEPIHGKVTGCFAASAEDAVRIALERQPNTAMGGTISQDLPLPRDFQTVAELVRAEDLEGSMSLGNDPAAWRDGIEQFERLGFTHICLHDVSENQAAFIEFAKQFVA